MVRRIFRVKICSTAYPSSIHNKSHAIHTIYYGYPPKSKVFRPVSAVMHRNCAERFPGENTPETGGSRNWDVGIQYPIFASQTASNYDDQLSLVTRIPSRDHRTGKIVKDPYLYRTGSGEPGKI
jgi:hypothetical protein